MVVSPARHARCSLVDERVALRADVQVSSCRWGPRASTRARCVHNAQMRRRDCVAAAILGGFSKSGSCRLGRTRLEEQGQHCQDSATRDVMPTKEASRNASRTLTRHVPLLLNGFRRHSGSLDFWAFAACLLTAESIRIPAPSAPVHGFCTVPTR